MLQFEKAAPLLHVPMFKDLDIAHGNSRRSLTNTLGKGTKSITLVAQKKRGFLGQYVAKKVFNWQYLRYKMVDGQLTYDPNGYSPMDKLEPYFIISTINCSETALRSKIVNTITTEKRKRA